MMYALQRSSQPKAFSADCYPPLRGMKTPLPPCLQRLHKATRLFTSAFPKSPMLLELLLQEARRLQAYNHHRKSRTLAHQTLTRFRKWHPQHEAIQALTSLLKPANISPKPTKR